jgi:D-3-phosphoglycerate dehydrogenase
VQYAPIDADVIAALPAVRVLARYGVGVDNVDLDAAAAAGVWVANVPDYGTEEVADHALALVYALLRAIPRLDRAVRSGDWDVTAVRPLRRVSTLTLGIVGAGRIGRATAEKARGVGLRVIVADPDAASLDGYEVVEFEDLLRTADIVSVHAPLTAATRHLIDAAALGRMRPGSYLVNTARGGLVDVDAVLEALTSGQLAGAAIDVLEHEPPGPDFALAAHPRAIVTPHAAWYSEESYRTLKQEAAREVVRVLEGGRPRSPVNEPVGEAR